MRQKIGAMLAIFGASWAMPLAAQAMADQPAACPAAPAPLPPELAGWPNPRPLKAAAAAGSSSAGLTIGTAATVALLPTPDVHYPLQPEKPGGSVSHGGLLSFTADSAGTYRVALGSGAWIDVVRGSKAVESIAHGHGPACSGIRKMVDFPLAAGRYILEISANGEASIAVMVTRLP